METQPKQGVAYRYTGNVKDMTKGEIYPIVEVNEDGITVVDDEGMSMTFHESEAKYFQEVDWTKATDEELLTEAKRRYIGKNTACLFSGTGVIVNNFEIDKHRSVWSYDENRNTMKLYDNDDQDWAEIIEEPAKEEKGISNFNPELLQCSNNSKEPKAGGYSGGI